MQPAPDHRQRIHYGFTLIELLVTITVIAILCMLLSSVIGQVRKAAVRTVCASNLRQWGAALNAYAADNRGLIPCTSKIWNILRYPSALWESGPHCTDTEEFSIPRLIDYMPSLGDTTVVIDGQAYLRTAGPWSCPASRSSKTWSPLITEWGNTYFHIQYSFYGQVERWSASTTRPEELTGRRLSADRILMNDLTWRFTGIMRDNLWVVNHMDGVFPNPGPPPIQGANTLMGDGRVEWRDRSRFPPALLQAGTPDGAYVITTNDDRFYF